jgi:hypothetical protein
MRIAEIIQFVIFVSTPSLVDAFMQQLLVLFLHFTYSGSNSQYHKEKTIRHSPSIMYIEAPHSR